MGRTLQMFERPKVPRIVRMHVTDAGQGTGDEDSMIVRYRCRRCKHETEWTDARTVTEAKRGVPCPNCNASS